MSLFAGGDHQVAGHHMSQGDVRLLAAACLDSLSQGSEYRERPAHLREDRRESRSRKI